MSSELSKDILSEEVTSEKFQNALSFLKTKMPQAHIDRLSALDSQKVIYTVAEFARLGQPDSIYVITGSEEDVNYLRKRSLELGEELPLKKKGQTLHFDDFGDQARDTANTRYLVAKGQEVNALSVQMDRDEGLKEMYGLLNGAMKGKEMYVGFYALGPVGSFMTIPAMQITDSAYVVHSEHLLYRGGYSSFQKALASAGEFFTGVHSAGELTPHKTSKNLDKRRIFSDLLRKAAYSVNCQYAGNSIALKKLFLRLAIWKATEEGWLAEHMFITGFDGPKGRTTYLMGAFPSGCGKTSTSMEGRIIGDDLAYLRIKDGTARTVNPERGMFGIIDGVNATDDPIVFKAIRNSEKEVIFSNVLQKDGEVFWTGMGMTLPEDGINFSGDWEKGKTVNGKEVDPSHKNARFTVMLSDLDNHAKEAEHPDGVKVGAILFGGRDADTSPPILQTKSWEQGVAAGATIVSAGTATEIGQEGKIKRIPMSNSEFISTSLGAYLRNYYAFGKKLSTQPQIYKINYFLEKASVNYDGPDTNPKIKLVGERRDTKAWLAWIELRTNGDVAAIDTPVGNMPKYEDMARLMKEKVGKDYSKGLYEAQFSLRTDKLIARNQMQIEAYKKDPSGIPEQLFKSLEEENAGLEALQKKHGKTVISPFDLDK